MRPLLHLVHNHAAVAAAANPADSINTGQLSLINDLP